MRDLKRQQQFLWYANIMDEIEQEDENGDLTGEFISQISKPKKAMFGVSATVGDPMFSPFGYDLQYSREITVSKEYSYELVEGTVLWVDVNPVIDRNGSLVMNEEKDEYLTPPDYYVKSKFNTQKGNVVRYAIAKRG